MPENEPPRFPWLPACDVILCADRATPVLRDSIESILLQLDSLPFLHLVDTGSAGHVFDDYESCWNVYRYRLPAGTTFLSAAHELIESMRTPFIANQSAFALSSSERLAESTRALEREGADFVVAECRGPDATVIRFDHDDKYSRKAHPATLVMRRATFVDMGGVCNIQRDDDDAEFLFRATQEKRKILLAEAVLVKMAVYEAVPPLGSAPSYCLSSSCSARTAARGFPSVSTACDVVLPFHGHLDFVEESLEGLLNQGPAELVIHLIDDASPEDTTAFLRRWSQQNNIRLYRNRENIGQFQSFNAVSRYFETDLAAVQDADDISLSHRFEWSNRMLHYSGADYFGGGIEIFGTEAVYNPQTQRCQLPAEFDGPAIRHSFYPHGNRDDYFLENPTSLFPISMFRQMGGYADFGDRTTNRTSIDMEFHERCRFHGIHFALSREIVVKYRTHADSATRNDQTGRGTKARTIGDRQQLERRRFYRRAPFNPKLFGSLERRSDCTVRL